jgi:protein ImuA
MTTKQQIIAQLKERIGAIEWKDQGKVTSYALGISDIDSALKHGGITAGSCHEILGPSGPALGFTLSLLSSMVKNGPVLWCAEQQDFYTPGFTTYGLNDTDIIFAETKNRQQSLWAMEQGLMCTKLSGVLLNASFLSLAQGRRLKLLAQQHKTTAIFMIKPKTRLSFPSIATTRWHISYAPSLGQASRNGNGVGAPRISIKLVRNLFGPAPLSWMVEFHEHTLRFHTVPQFLSSTHQASPAKSSLRARQGIP